MRLCSSPGLATDAFLFQLLSAPTLPLDILTPDFSSVNRFENIETNSPIPVTPANSLIMNSPSTKTSDGKTYDRLSEDDNESNATLLGDKSQGWKSFSESHSRGGCCRRSLVRVFSGLVIFSSVVALIFISTKVHHIEENLIHGVNLGDCGKLSTVEEARALGCIFDPMSWVWVRPECYDAELVADFMNRTDWSWHTDPKLTPESVVPMDEIYRGDHPKLFISKMYHTVHCAVRGSSCSHPAPNHGTNTNILPRTVHVEKAAKSPYNA